MIDRALKWLADRPLSRHRWFEDIYARAEMRRWERFAKRKAGDPKFAGPAPRNQLPRRKESNSSTR